MKMKEIEALSGMTRANIRFYESEGLINPERSENGYRNYSQTDLEILKRIKLLRSLHISLEEIKSLHHGERELLDSLEQHLKKLTEEQADLERSKEVCREMQADGVQYQTLDAQRYLDVMEQGRGRQSVPELAADAVPKVRAPWRRFFARALDMSLYGLLLDLVLILGLNFKIAGAGGGWDLFRTILTVGLMFAAEPVLLAKLGTTPGKWIMGLRVTGLEGGNLTYSQALERTTTMFWQGRGAYIPIYSLYREWVSMKACEDGDTLDWEHESELVLRDSGWRNVAGYLGAQAIIFAILVVAQLAAQNPRYRGEITAAQFCENFNRLAAYHNLYEGERLDDSGAWVGDEKNDFTVYLGGYLENPDFRFEEKNGVITRVSFEETLQNSQSHPASRQNQMSLAVLSFVQAQHKSLNQSEELKQLLLAIEEHPYQDFQLTAHGVTVTCEVEYSGYDDRMASVGYLVPLEGQSTAYSMYFVMEK